MSSSYFLFLLSSLQSININFVFVKPYRKFFLIIKLNSNCEIASFWFFFPVFIIFLLLYIFISPHVIMDPNNIKYIYPSQKNLRICVMKWKNAISTIYLHFLCHLLFHPRLWQLSKHLVFSTFLSRHKTKMQDSPRFVCFRWRIF